jgi:enoyl-CoA hydratase/carnithine racemase
MSDINTGRFNSILQVELSRPERKNALTSSRYTRLAALALLAEDPT